MADTMYAWTNFPGLKKKVGDSISKSDLETDETDVDVDAEWESLIMSGAIRREKYPEVAAGESPTEYYRRKLFEEQSGTFPEWYLTEEQSVTPNTEPADGVDSGQEALDAQVEELQKGSAPSAAKADEETAPAGTSATGAKK